MGLRRQSATAALACAACATLLASCGERKAATPPPAPVAVTAVTVKARDLPLVQEFVGQTESSQQVEIRARIDGFLEKRAYTEGTLVKPGQVLFLIDRKPLQATLAAAQAELSQQVARLNTARANLARVKPLVEDDALAARQLDDATGVEQAAAAAVEAAQAKVVSARLNLGYATITSPVGGLSSFAKVQEGAYVNAQNNLLTYVAKLDPMRVNFSVSENETLRLRSEVAAGRIRTSADQQYLVDVILADGTTYPVQGRITFFDAGFSNDTGTFLVRAELPNPRGVLRPGQFVRVRLHGLTRVNAIVVPQAAVQEGARGAFVWVAGPDSKAQQRAVKAGPWLDDDWLVSSGLADGDRVIVGGTMKLAPGAAVQVAAPAAAPASRARP